MVQKFTIDGEDVARCNLGKDEPPQPDNIKKIIDEITLRSESECQFEILVGADFEEQIKDHPAIVALQDNGIALVVAPREADVLLFILDRAVDSGAYIVSRADYTKALGAEDPLVAEKINSMQIHYFIRQDRILLGQLVATRSLGVSEE